MRPCELSPELQDRLDAMVALCRRYGVERLEVFGSAADGRFDAERSDFDFIVRFTPEVPGLSASLGRRFVGLAEELESLLGRRVDLMTDQPIRNPYFRRAVDASRRLLYERASEQAPV